QCHQEYVFRIIGMQMEMPGSGDFVFVFFNSEIKRGDGLTADELKCGVRHGFGFLHGTPLWLRELVPPSATGFPAFCRSCSVEFNLDRRCDACRGVGKSLYCAPRRSVRLA